MPDKVRSVDDMVTDMERAVKEPEGNTSSAKHRQHVAQAIEKLISSQIIDGKLRYIEDGTGSKVATKTAPALLNVAAAVQEMVSEMSGRKMSYTITIEGKAAAAAPKPTGKPRGRPPKDPAGTNGNNNNFTIGSINPTTNGARYRCTVNLNGTQVNLDSTDADGMRYGRRNVVRLIIDGQNYRGRTYQWIINNNVERKQELPDFTNQTVYSLNLNTSYGSNAANNPKACSLCLLPGHHT